MRYGSELICPGLVAAFALAALLPAAAVRAEHGTFSFDVKRFELTEGGAPSFVDEFDDDVIGPRWAQIFGTGVESGGVLTLRDPGTDQPLNFPGGTLFLDRSDLHLTGTTLGPSQDFLAESTWASEVPAVNDFYGLIFSYRSAEKAISYHAVTITNPDAFNALKTDTPAGPQMLFLRTAVQPFESVPFDSGDFTEWELDFVEFDPGDVTGDIVLRIAFDATGSEFTGSASLDGGSTFTTFDPEPAAATFASPTGLTLIADPITALDVPVLHPLGWLALAGALLASAQVARRRTRFIRR